MKRQPVHQKEKQLDLFDSTDSFSSEQIRYLLGPVAHQSRGWSDSVPEWLIEALPSARLAVIRDEIRGGEECGLCSDQEVLIVMFGASLDAPISGDYASIYQLLAMRVMRKRGIQVEPLEECFKVEQLSEWQEKLLLDLKRRIRQSIVRNFNKENYGKKKEKQGAR